MQMYNYMHTYKDVDTSCLLVLRQARPRFPSIPQQAAQRPLQVVARLGLFVGVRGLSEGM